MQIKETKKQKGIRLTSKELQYFGVSMVSPSVTCESTLSQTLTIRKTTHQSTFSISKEH